MRPFPGSSTLTLAMLSLAIAGPVFAQPMMPPRQNPQELCVPIAVWTNMARAPQGKPPLKINESLTRAAQLHAQNMAVQELMAHSLDGETLSDRLRRVGYRHGGAGENVAVVGGYEYPAWALFDGWMRSEGHYRNIMNDQFTEFGVGVAQSKSGKYYACQVFARPASAPPYQAVQSPYTGMYPSYAMYGPPAQTSSPYGYPQPRVPYTTTPAWLQARPAAQQPTNDFHWFIPWNPEQH